MNGWRWLGVFVLAAGIITLGLSASGQTGKDKGQTAKTAKGTGKETTTKETTTKKEDTKKEATGKEKIPVGELALRAFEGKTPFYQTLDTVTEQKMTVSGMNHEQTQKQTFWFEWTPKGEKDGTFTVVQKILGVKMDINIAGNPISYDSTAAAQPKNPMVEFFKTLVNSEFTLTIGRNKEGRYVVESVKGVEGAGGLIERLGKVNPQMVPLLKRILTEESIKQMAEPMLGVVPPNGVVPKDKTWTTTNTLNMGPIGTYVTKNKYTLEGPGKEKHLLQIKVDTDLTYSPPGENEKGLPFAIKSASLKAGKDSGGTIIFNTKDGRVESADMNIKLAGTLNIEIATMTTEVRLDQTQVTKLRTSDKNPLAK
jgi:hypothetical protein